METALVETLAREGFRDPHVLAALMRVPRNSFVAADPSPETSSPPFVVATMLAALAVRPGAKVLEIGTGSGYQAAVLAELGAQVFSLERLGAVAERAALNLARAGVRVHLRAGDGRFGWAAESPFDRIVVNAACEAVPRALLNQLAVGGRLVAPLGGPEAQVLQVLTRGPSGVVRSEPLGRVQFPPLVGTAH